MRRPRTAALLLAGLIPALAAGGCGRKKTADPETASAAPAPEPTPAARTPSPAAPDPGPDTPPAEGNGLFGLPRMALPTTDPQPTPPGPGGPAAPSAPRSGEPPPPFVVPMPPGTPQPNPPQPGPGPAPPPPNPTPPGPDPTSASAKPKEPEWPTEVNGRKLADYIQDTNDPDPAIREVGLRTLPVFGPAARKEAGRAVLARMDFQKEKDPAVRAAAFEAAGAIGFESDADTKEAVRLLSVAADQGAPGGGTRLHAVQTLGSFGPKAEAAVPYLTGGPASDLSYETRRSVAATLGQIAGNEKAGPSRAALNCLVTKLIEDPSAAVRLQAYQSIVVLGPPWEAPPKGPPGSPPPPPPGPNNPPKSDQKAVDGYVAAIKKRLAPVRSGGKQSPTGLVEPDKQVEIFARLALMRLEPKEVTDENLAGITRYLSGPEYGPKVMALSALAAMGEVAARRIDDVVKLLDDPDVNLVTSAVTTLAAMGPAAKPAVPFLEKLKGRGTKKEEKDYYTKLAEEAIKVINAPRSPSVAAPPPAEKKP